MTMARLELEALAKINLSLEVLARRPDGYHEVRMLMAAVSLADSLTFEEAADLSLECDREGLDCGESNLVLRAARALHAALGRRPGARIRLRKRIPIGGGLAGGSADAAAALKGLNALWGGGLDAGRLEELGAALGSDIPFCLRGGWAIATGRGEALRGVEPRGPLHLVLANPGFEVSTAWVYGALSIPAGRSGDRSAATYEALARGDAQALDLAAINDLEPVAMARHPEIAALKRSLMERGALVSRMSGSGPTVWGLFPLKETAAAAAAALRVAGIWAEAVQSA